MYQHKIVLLSSALLATSVAAAADQPADSGAAQAPLAEIVVTGSSIPTTPDTIAVPVDTLSAAQLEASGVDSKFSPTDVPPRATA